MLSTNQVEAVLCRAGAVGSIDALVPPVPDAWSADFPDLGSLPAFNGARQRLRVCIATEDIAGPVRNGGIGTAYAALGDLLSEGGHDTTVLYLRGHDVEDGTVAEWTAHYAAKGIHFVPVPNYAAVDDFRVGTDRWLHAPYNLLRYLLLNRMDVVHVSEWRGAAYLSLLAKRQGLAFARTLFVVKTSSPWMWDRLYGSRPLEQIQDLGRVHAERASVELADVVVGGSRHLLRWMSSQGYRLPPGRTFVQPNVVGTDRIAGAIGDRTAAAGTRVPVEEFVFFGRLEGRKGLLVFCQAIRRMVRAGLALPPRISFLGKPGARLAVRPHQSVLEFLEAETADWPTEVRVLSDLQQGEALEYLLAGPRLAVMPSIIENASMAVYEAAICGIPFVASAAGGTPELVAPGDRPHVLCDPHPIPLAAKLAAALADGGYVARPSLPNEANRAAWRGFHANLARGLLRHLLDQREGARAQGTPAPAVAACVYYTGDDGALAATLGALAAQEVRPAEVLIAVDAEEAAAAARAAALAEDAGLAARVIDAFDCDAGLAFNRLAELARGELLLFLWAGAALRPRALGALLTVARASGADLLNHLYRVTPATPGGRTYLKAPVIGSLSEEFFRTDFVPMPLLVRREAFRALEGFTADYRVLGYDHELIAKAQLSGLRCETALFELGSAPALDEAWLARRKYDVGASHFRGIRPQLAAAPLGMRDLLLTAKGMQLKGRAGRDGAGRPRGTGPAAGARAVNGAAHPVARAASAARGREGEPLLALLAADAPPQDAAMAALGPEGPPAGCSAPAVRIGRADEAGLLAAFLHAAGAATDRGPVAKVLAVCEGVLHGWALDPADPARTVEVEILVDGRVRSRVPASRPCPYAFGAPPALDGHGFAVGLYAAPYLAPLVRQLRRHRLGRAMGDLLRPPLSVSVRVAGTCEPAGEPLSPTPPGIGIEATPWRGYCDPSDHGLVQGWAWRPDAPDEPVDVAVFLDGTFLARLVADDYREDLAANHVGNGAHGFRLPLARRFRTGEPHRIQVVVADAGTTLRRGRLRAAGGKVIEIQTPSFGRMKR